MENATVGEKLAVLAWKASGEEFRRGNGLRYKGAGMPKELTQAARTKLERARARRIELGYTLRELGEMIGVSPEAISRWELGRSGVNRQTGELCGAALLYCALLQRLEPNPAKREKLEHKPRRRRRYEPLTSRWSR